MSTIAVPAAGTRLALTALPPLSLYVHIPWCVRKCPYCDFNSHEARGDVPERDYVDALIADLEATLPQVWGRRVQTIFFGGGTPSLFSAAAHRRAARRRSRARLPLAPDAEITLEANPGHLRGGQVRATSAPPASTGSRSASRASTPRTSQALGRIHDARRGAPRGRDRARALRQLQPRPDVRAAAARRSTRREADIAAALRLRAAAPVGLPPHARAQHAVPPPSAAAARRRPGRGHAGARSRRGSARPATSTTRPRPSRGPGAQCAAQPQLLALRRLPRHRRRRARASCRSTTASCARRARKQPREYMKRVAGGRRCRSAREVARRELPFEFMMNALRLAEGFPVALFAERTGLPINAAERGLAAAEAKGLIERDDRPHPADPARAALPERPAGAVPAGLALRPSRAA